MGVLSSGHRMSLTELCHNRRDKASQAPCSTLQVGPETEASQLHSSLNRALCSLRILGPAGLPQPDLYSKGRLTDNAALFMLKLLG